MGTFSTNGKTTKKRTKDRKKQKKLSHSNPGKAMVVLPSMSNKKKRKLQNVARKIEVLAEQDHLEEKVKVAERKKDAAESAKIRANKGVMGDDD